MRKKRTREENEARTELFRGKLNIRYRKIDKATPYIWIFIACLNVTILGSRWIEYSPILFCLVLLSYLTIISCYFIPQLKKYTSILNIFSIIIFFTSLDILDLLKGKTASYFSLIGTLLLFLGPHFIDQPLMSIRTRKWLSFLFVVLSISLCVYVFDKPSLDTLMIPLVIAMLINMFFFIGINIHEQKEKEKELDQLKQAQTLAKLSSLKDQLSPHFLFNTLNTITSISQEQTVKDFVDEVANIYRYVLQFKEVDSVTLRQEMEFIQSYLYIIKSRLEGGIDFDINIENENLLDSKMPPLTLQMLIENAVKHNSTSIDKPLSINIFTTEGPMLVVQNYYQPKLSVLPGNETGLKNIAERYRLLYKKEIVVENKNGFFTVKLPIVMA